MMVGTSEEPMLSSKLTAVEKRDPTGECLWGNISLNGYGIRFYPGYLYFTGVLQRGTFACAREIVVGSERKPRSLWS